MTDTEEKINLTVIKRNGKKVDFDGTKIIFAIKKGFDSVNTQDEQTGKYKYDNKDITKIYNDVIKNIEKNYSDKIKIEQIQDLIEESLKNKGYDGIIIKGTNYDSNRFGNQNNQYVEFYSNQIKNVDNINPTKINLNNGRKYV